MRLPALRLQYSIRSHGDVIRLIFIFCSQLSGDGPLLNMFKLFTSLVMPQSVMASTRSISTSGGPLLFRSSTPLSAEPLKKKKRLDPQILKAREDRKRKKVEKAIRKLEKVCSH